MKSKYIEAAVYKNERISDCVFRLSVKGSFDVKPGQFFMLRAWDQEPLLSRPISVHDVDDEKITFLYHIVGRGTQIFSKLREGDAISLLGPLGNGFDIDMLKGKVALVGGGIGVAPLNYLYKQLSKKDDVQVSFHAGYRSQPFGLECIQGSCSLLNIATEDACVGKKGYIIDYFEPKDYDMVVCCGPEIMMSKLIKKCEAAGVPILVSMEKKMACGIGACLVCTCKTKEGNKRSCADGPVFLGSELILND